MAAVQSRFRITSVTLEQLKEGASSGCGSVGTSDGALPSGGLPGATLSLCWARVLLTLGLVPFDHAWTLGQDGFLEGRHQSVDATLHQLQQETTPPTGVTQSLEETNPLQEQNTALHTTQTADAAVSLDVLS